MTKLLPCPSCGSEHPQFFAEAALTLRCTTCMLSLRAPLNSEKYLASMWNDLPRNVTLTHVPPVVPGFYFKFYTANKESFLTIKYISQCFINEGIEQKECILWAGPICEPKISIGAGKYEIF